MTVDTSPCDIGAADAADFLLPAHTLYLDTAAQGPRLRSVINAGQQALEASIAPWRLSFADWESQIEALRACAAETLFDRDTDGLAMVPSAAYGLATAAHNLPLDAGGAVLVLDGQFPSNLLVWQQRCADRGARVVAAQRRHAQDWTAAVFDALDAGPDVRIVALPHAHWSDGALLDLDRIAPRVRDHGAALVLDLSQSLGALPLDLARWSPDFVVGVGHKWLLGPTGLAWLWASPRWRRDGQPIEQHWNARDAGRDWHFPTSAPPPFRSGARRFDAGGVADPLRVAMSMAAMTQLQRWGVSAVCSRLAVLTDTLDTALDAHGLDAWRTPDHAPHFSALRPPTGGAERIAAAFACEGIVCTHRHGLLRIAPHLHVDDDAMRRMVDIAAHSATSRGDVTGRPL